jgi:hypothetical protein
LPSTPRLKIQGLIQQQSKSKDTRTRRLSLRGTIKRTRSIYRGINKQIIIDYIFVKFFYTYIENFDEDQSTSWKEQRRITPPSVIGQPTPVGTTPASIRPPPPIVEGEKSPRSTWAVAGARHQ